MIGPLISPLDSDCGSTSVERSCIRSHFFKYFELIPRYETPVGARLSSSFMVSGGDGIPLKIMTVGSSKGV